MPLVYPVFFLAEAAQDLSDYSRNKDHHMKTRYIRDDVTGHRYVFTRFVSVGEIKSVEIPGRVWSMSPTPMDDSNVTELKPPTPRRIYAALAMRIKNRRQYGDTHQPTLKPT